MKIRTDFVTNSSSSSFVRYIIEPKNKRKENIEHFNEHVFYIEHLCKKYGVAKNSNYVEGLIAPDDGDDYKIEFVIPTPGLSDAYVDDGGDKEEFREYARWDSSYPPEIVVALSALFGNNSTEDLRDLSISTEVLDDDGELSDKYITSLTAKEVKRLYELLADYQQDKEEYLKITQTEFIEDTD